MNVFKSSLAAGCLFCLTAAVQAAPLSEAKIKEVEKQVAASRASWKTLQMQVRQSLVFKGMDKPVQSRGTLYYRKPGSLLIRFAEPQGDSLLINPEMVVVAKKGEKPKIRRVSVQEMKNRPVLLLDAFEKNPADWRQDFRVEMDRTGKSVTVQLTPLKPSSSLPGKILVTLEEASWNITGLRIEAQDTVMDYRFTGHRKNPSLAANLFVWKDPS